MLMAFLMLFSSAIPVLIIMGFFVLAIFLINLKSSISGEAILYKGQLSFSSKSTAVRSNGAEKHKILFFFANLKISLCHFIGVCPNLYKL